MFRKELPEGQGMLFDFSRDQEVDVLDEEHLRPARHDLHPRRRPHPPIADNTVPLSEALVSSGGPVPRVLEVVAGTAKKLGIAPGDRVAHPIFSGR